MGHLEVFPKGMGPRVPSYFLYALKALVKHCWGKFDQGMDPYLVVIAEYNPRVCVCIISTCAQGAEVDMSE
jgi:hypothetical protein